MTAPRWICDECGHVTTTPLDAPHPFIEGERVDGCPSCQDCKTLSRACDEPGCRREATCGTPAPGGYRRVCGDHYEQITKGNG